MTFTIRTRRPSTVARGLRDLPEVGLPREAAEALAPYRRALLENAAAQSQADAELAAAQRDVPAARDRDQRALALALRSGSREPDASEATKAADRLAEADRRAGALRQVRLQLLDEIEALITAQRPKWITAARAALDEEEARLAESLGAFEERWTAVATRSATIAALARWPQSGAVSQAGLPQTPVAGLASYGSLPPTADIVLAALAKAIERRR